MARRTKVTISLDRGTLDVLDELGQRRGASRSRLIEEAVRLLRQRELADRLRAGYVAMAEEDRATAEAMLGAVAEVLE
jgi:metal-responsive CopG/Arc/MetJ family transcriptional regulator